MEKPDTGPSQGQRSKYWATDSKCTERSRELFHLCSTHSFPPGLKESWLCCHTAIAHSVRERSPCPCGKWDPARTRFQSTYPTFPQTPATDLDGQTFHFSPGSANISQQRLGLLSGAADAASAGFVLLWMNSALWVLMTPVQSRGTLGVAVASASCLCAIFKLRNPRKCKSQRKALSGRWNDCLNNQTRQYYSVGGLFTLYLLCNVFFPGSNASHHPPPPPQSTM